MSRLVYSNGLFYGLPKCTVSGMQPVQNSAARIVTQERLLVHNSMSRALIGLYWLPVDKRIEYKLLLYTYKSLHDLAPGYLCEWVGPYVPRRVLRSAELNLLTVPPGKNSKNVSLLGVVLELSRATFSSNVYHCILLVSLYVIHVILLFGMFTILDY